MTNFKLQSSVQNTALCDTEAYSIAYKVAGNKSEGPIYDLVAKFSLGICHYLFVHSEAELIFAIYTASFIEEFSRLEVANQKIVIKAIPEILDTTLLICDLMTDKYSSKEKAIFKDEAQQFILSFSECIVNKGLISEENIILFNSCYKCIKDFEFKYIGTPSVDREVSR